MSGWARFETLSGRPAGYRQPAAKQLGVLNQGDIGTRGHFQVGIGNYGQAAPAPMQLVVSTPDSETV